MKNTNSFTTIASYNSLPEAMVAKSLLEANGIWCATNNENISYLQTLAYMAFGGIKLTVRTEDAEIAKELLNNIETKSEFVVKEADRTYFNKKRLKTFFLILMLLILIFVGFKRL